MSMERKNAAKSASTAAVEMIQPRLNIATWAPSKELETAMDELAAAAVGDVEVPKDAK